MSDPRDDLRSGDGKEPAGGPLVRLFAVQLLAVLAITVVLTGAYALIKGDDKATDTTRAVSGPAASAPPASSPAPAPSAPPSSAPPAPSPTPTATGSAGGGLGHRPEVVMFNQSAPNGSGQVAAGLLRAKGWSVLKVDDFHGNVSRTTVYYPDGLKRAARRAANDLPGNVRVRPKFSNLSETRLTVILTDNFQG